MVFFLKVTNLSSLITYSFFSYTGRGQGNDRFHLFERLLKCYARAYFLCCEL
jgi:hypothetical protein